MNSGRAVPARVGYGLLLVGAALVVTAFVGLRLDIEWIAQPFYAWAWWGYILLLDGFSVCRRGSSLLTTRWRFAVPAAVWSVTFWCFFELLNVRLQNWYYVGVMPARNELQLLAGGLFTFAAFSTVFIGIFATYDALTAAGLWRKWRGKPGRLPGWVSWVLQGLGVAMAVAALGWPYWLAPLVWGSFTFIVDSWNYRRGARSFLRDLEARDWGTVARVFVAGLICGFVWESLNFFAPQKWIYTVRGLEGLKLFEMPLLGFLGFPALAYDSMAAFSCLSFVFLGNTTWEEPSDLAYELTPVERQTPVVWRSTLVAQPLFWALVALIAVGVNIGSLQLEIADVAGIKAPGPLAELGIARPRQLLARAEDDEGRREILARTGWTTIELDEALRRARLYTFKGIGAEFGDLLERSGVRDVPDLAPWAPEDLHAEIVEVAARRGVRAPRLDMVRVWVLASRAPGILLR